MSPQYQRPPDRGADIHGDEGQMFTKTHPNHPHIQTLATSPQSKRK
jgi:hypothetical protein